MSGSKLYCQIKLTVLVLLLTIAFQSPCLAFTLQKAYKISGGDIPKISAEIYFHVHNKKHKLLVKDTKNGLYHYQPNILGTSNEHCYVITSVQKINDDIFLYTKNNFNGSSYKKQLLKHLKKYGLKYKKVKDKELLAELESNTNELLDKYKYAKFYAGVSNEKTEKEKITKEPVSKPTPKPVYKPTPVKQRYTPQPQHFNTAGREISKAGSVFNSVKDGVVTIILGYGHGSGFLVDPRGLILTNYHVVKEVEDENLRVRFGQNQIVGGKVIATDSRNDAAVIWVNLKNIKNYRVLNLAYPGTGNSLVVMGEKVLAIGSPLEWEKMEKTLTQGVVSKCDKSVIMHDANIDGGNSGGPLLNFDGYVVGINTFHPSRSRGLSGSVPITKAYNVLNEAKQKLSTLAMPTPDLMPDVSPIPYSFEILENAYNLSDKKTKKRDEYYEINAGDFDIFIITPAIEYRAYANKDKRTMKRFIKRQEKHGYEVTDDDYESKGMAYFRNPKPVVMVVVIPKPKTTLISKSVNLLANAAGIVSGVFTGFYYIPGGVYTDYTFDKDFQKLNLLNKNTGKTCTPYTAGKAPYSVDVAESYGYSYAKFSEKTYRGIYEFDPRCFLTGDDLIFNLYYSKHEPPITEEVDEKTKNYILEDFKPYWEHIGN